MTTQDYLLQLERDFKIPQDPEYFNQKTQLTLHNIAQSIVNGNYTMSEFRSYVRNNFGDHHDSFGAGCISTVLDYIIDNTCRK